MRIADKMKYDQVNTNIARNRTEMAQLQNQAATQKRVTKPSDDPLAAARVLASRTEEKGVEQFTKNLNIAKSFLEYSDQSLAELSDALIRAKELAIAQAGDGGSTPDSKKAVAAEIEQTYYHAIQIGNRKLGDRFIFGGHKTVTQPFDEGGNYHGDDGDIKIQVNKDNFIAMNIPGDKIFHGVGLAADGVARSRYYTPTTSKELEDYKHSEEERIQRKNEMPHEPVKGLRGLASVDEEGNGKSDMSLDTNGANVFGVLKRLEIGLQTDDKEAIQDTLNDLDEALAQVVLARSQLGARVMALDSNMESLQKAKVDAKTTASQLEDADVFQVMSDITKNEGSLKATLETSGKMIQPSLLDFLR